MNNLVDTSASEKDLPVQCKESLILYLFTCFAHTTMTKQKHQIGYFSKIEENFIVQTA